MLEFPVAAKYGGFAPVESSIEVPVEDFELQRYPRLPPQQSGRIRHL